MENKRSSSKRGFLKIKVKLYITSLLFLNILFIILTVDIPLCFELGARFIGFKELFKRNVFPCVNIMLMILGLFYIKRFNYYVSGVNNMVTKIEKLESKNYEYLTFLTTYIVPFIGFDFSNVRYRIAIIFLLTFVGFIFIKMDLYYGNPTLAAFGYRLYTAVINKKRAVLISKSSLNDGDFVQWIKLDENTYCVRKVE